MNSNITDNNLLKEINQKLKPLDKKDEAIRHYIESKNNFIAYCEKNKSTKRK